MTLGRVGMGVVLFLTASSPLDASTFVVRDSIGDSSASTDEMPGALTLHDGASWNTPGLVVNPAVSGKLVEARFVIFGVTGTGAFFPENNVDNVSGNPMGFHVWTDGVLGGIDSFDENPQGLETVPGHILLDVNTATDSFIAVEPFGHTGPPGDVNAFMTFLVTIDLSSFDVHLQGGTEYVMSVIQHGQNFVSGTGFFRILASKAIGFEDLFRDDTSTARPGYVQTQLGLEFQQYAGSLTLAPLLVGDYNFDGDVDSFDYGTWRETFGSTTDLRADGNDDDIVNAADYVVWRNHVDTSSGGGSSSSVLSVPEPNALTLLLLLTLTAILRRPRR